MGSIVRLLLYKITSLCFYQDSSPPPARCAQWKAAAARAATWQLALGQARPRPGGCSDAPRWKKVCAVTLNRDLHQARAPKLYMGWHNTRGAARPAARAAPTPH